MSRRGFSLLEVVLALALMSLLVSAAGPLISRVAALGKPEDSVDQAALEALLVSDAAAMEMFQRDHGRIPQIETRWVPRQAGPAPVGQSPLAVQDWSEKSAAEELGLELRLVRSGDRLALCIEPKARPQVEREGAQ